MAELDEAVRAVLRGDTGRYGEIVKACAPGVRAVLSAMTQDHDMVPDLVQETFLIAYRRLDTYEPGTDFFAWLRAIARNVARNEKRRQQRRDTPDTALNPGETDAIENRAETVAQGLPPDILDALEDCVRRLDERARMLVDAFYHQGRTVKEIAGREGLSETAVKVALFRARRAIHQCLRKKGIMKA